MLASGAKYSWFQSVSILSGCVMIYKLSACRLPHYFLLIEIILQVTAFEEINMAQKLIQVIDSIPWVRCASGNAFFNDSQLKKSFCRYQN